MIADSQAYTKNIPTFAFGTQVAEIEIDEDTGEVKILKIIAAHETGRTINKTMAEGQIEGSVVQGIGYTFFEKLVLENGRVFNDGFLDYKIPNIGDIPEIETILVETDDPHGPFGAKGIGEPGLVPTAAVIVNAIYNASAIRCHELPIACEFILNAMMKQKKENK
jgi:CO/xanthine dehydrogenase Mo-binding subunit